MSKLVVSQTLSLYFYQVMKLDGLARELNRNRSELAREALDDLFAKYDAPKVSDVENVVMPTLPLVYGEPEATA